MHQVTAWSFIFRNSLCDIVRFVREMPHHVRKRVQSNSTVR